MGMNIKMNASVSSTTSQLRARPSKSPTRMALERFAYNKMAVVSSVVLLLVGAACLAAPLLTHWNAWAQDLMNTDAPPGHGHLFGTNAQGMDYFSRDLYGGRIDLLVGSVDMTVIIVISMTLGGLAGYYGGWVDAIIMRACDLMLNFPFLLLILVLEAVLNNSSVWLLIAVIGATGWPALTRMVRGLFLSLRDAEFVLASRMAGARPIRIIFKHMLPNVVSVLVVQATLLFATVIFTESALAIIGFGVHPPTPSWGNVLANAQGYFTLKTEPWAWVPPAALITITVLCINYIGDGLRDAFDPGFEM